MSGKAYIVVHHTAGGRGQKAEEITRFLRADPPAGRGFKGGAYAKIIEADGSVHDDAKETAIGVAHAIGFNRTGIGVCMIGWFDTPETIAKYGSSYHGDLITADDPQFKALVQTCVVLCRRHNIPVRNIVGHRDTFVLRGKPVGKTCPGERLYALLPELRKRVQSYL